MTVTSRFEQGHPTHPRAMAHATRSETARKFTRHHKQGAGRLDFETLYYRNNQCTTVVLCLTAYIYIYIYLITEH